MTPLQKQTAREMKEGARQSKRHARALAFEKHAAKARKMSLSDYRDWKFKQWEKRRLRKHPERTDRTPAPVQDDPNVVYPRQVRRQAIVADVLMHRNDKPTPRKLRYLQVLQLLEQASKIVEDLL